MSEYDSESSGIEGSEITPLLPEPPPATQNPPPAQQETPPGSPTSPKPSLTEKITSLLSLQYALVIAVIGGSLTIAQVTSTQDSTFSGLVTCDIEPLQQHAETFNTYLAFTSIIGFFLVCCLPGCTNGTECERFLRKPDILLMGTFLFGLGSATWFLLRLVSESYCLNGNHTEIDMMHSGAQFVFVGLEILFLIAHSNVTFTSNCFSKAFLMHVFATNFCLWFRIVAGEAVEREQHLPLVCNETVTETRCIKRSVLDILVTPTPPTANGTGFPTHILHLVEKSTPFLYPCVAEFCLSASGLLFKKWLFPKNKQRQPNAHGCQYCCLPSLISCPKKCLAFMKRLLPNRGTRQAINREDSRNSARCSQNCCCCLYEEIQDEENDQFFHIHRRRISYVGQLCVAGGIAFILLIPLAVVSMVFVASLTDTDTPLGFPILYDASQLVIVSSALVFSTFGIIVLIVVFTSQGLEQQQLSNNDSKEMVVEAALLMIPLAGLYLAQGLELTAILDNTYLDKILRVHVNESSACHHMLNIERSTGFLIVLLASLQTLFIIGALGLKKIRRQRNQNLANSGQTGNEQGNEQTNIMDEQPSLGLCIKIVAIILLICNITLWLFKTFELSGLYCHPLFYRFYDDSWLQLSDIVYPFWIFFHFHSFASCVDILR